MARRVSASQARSRLRQAQSKIKQAARKQKQAIDAYNHAARAHNQKRNRAISEYNRDMRAHNARVRSNRQRLESELRKLRSASARSHSVAASARTVHSAFVRVDLKQRDGAVYPADLFELFEAEAANSLESANAIDAAQTAEDDEIAELQATTIAGELRALAPDLAGRWDGALFSLNPRNPDAARHFCTSARECIVGVLDVAAPDELVKRELSTCSYTDDGRVTRRSKLKYLLVRKGLLDDAVEQFVNADVDDILALFRIFNDGTHGEAGRFALGELVAVKRRAEAGIRFLYQLRS